MRLLISIMLAGLVFSFAPPARAQSQSLVVSVCGTLPLAYAPGAVRTDTIDVNGNKCTAGTVTISGVATAANQVLQITQETAINTLLGLQADAACATDNGTCTLAALVKRLNQRLTTLNTTLGSPFQAGGSIGNTTFAVTNAGTFAVQAALPATPLIASGSGFIAAPTSVSTGATTRASGTAAASNLVLKASAGNLYDLGVVVGATSGYLLLFDAASLPGNGAVTPVFCDRINSDGTAGGAKYAWPMPFPFATGITAGFSTTGCFTLTASATASFFGGYK